LAAFLEDKLAPADPHPEAQRNLRALADAIERGEAAVVPVGMQTTFAALQQGEEANK